MIRAGALFISISMAFVMALLCSFLIVFAFHYRLQNKENILLKKLELNTSSAINILLSENDQTFIEDSKTLDLYGEEADSVFLKKKTWGVYQIALVKAFSGKYSFTKAMEYGYVSEDAKTTAIYLTDLSRPLNLCGKTKIIGNCYLPDAGVKKGYVEGKSFEGDSLIRGKIRKSKNALPEINKALKKMISQMLTAKNFGTGDFKSASGEADTIRQSFMDSTVVIRYHGNATISNHHFSGNIIIYADSLLTINGNSVLQHVILVARRIKINKGFRGNIQAFAADSIVVEENSKLEYPSVLGIFKLDYKTTQPYISIRKGSEVKGIVFTSIAENITDLKQTLIRIGKDALVQGQIYVEGYADIKGTVYGSVSCNKFLFGTAYENYLMDAVIDCSRLSRHYVGSELVNSAADKKIIQWLD